MVWSFWQAKSELTGAVIFAWILTSYGIANAEPVYVELPLVVAESSATDFPGILTATPTEADTSRWNIHGQATYVTQQKNNFTSPYYGSNSLLNKNEGGGAKSYTFSATAFLGAKLWDGAEVYYNPEMFQGTPFNGQLVGLGGFQNGELQKGSFANPVYYTSRAFLRQTVDLGGERQYVGSSANQLAGMTDQNKLVLSYGKFATLDFFDQNTYSHDTRTQFQNFALFSMGAYSYAADTKGYTYGVVAEWFQDDWILKAARLALPTIPNTQALDVSLSKNYINQIELTHKHEFLGSPGALRALYYQQSAYMGRYQNAISQGQQTNSTPDITSVRQATQRTFGYGLNMEQAINKNIGMFARWSWNPGDIETQTVDISRSLSGGVAIKGTNWERPNDTIGLGFALNGLSRSQITYLQQGGKAPFIGDGGLSYKKEQIFESYYSAKVYKEWYLTVDYQRIANPAYNASRGPVNFIGIRAHTEI